MGFFRVFFGEFVRYRLKAMPCIFCNGIIIDMRAHTTHKCFRHMRLNFLLRDGCIIFVKGELT